MLYSYCVAPQTAHAVGRAKHLTYLIGLLSGIVLLSLAELGAVADQPPASALPQGITFLEESVAGPYVFTGTVTVSQPAQAELRVVFNLGEQTGDHYLLSVKGNEAQFYKVHGGNNQPLGLSGTINWQTGEPVNFSLRRERWRISFIYGAQVITRAYDSNLDGNRVGYSAKDCTISDWFIQELGEMYMSDDFMRPPDEESGWEVVSGTWRQQSLRVDRQAERMQAELSANAFSYLGKAAEGRALATVGYWFWEGYLWQAAMRAVKEGAMGVVGYYQDPDNYLAVRWTSRLPTSPEADRLELIEVKEGQENILAETQGGFLSGQWYQMGLVVSGGLVTVYIDDQLRLAARTDHFGQGQVGFLAEGEAGVFFDDALLRRWAVLSEKFEQPVPGKWQVLCGQWALGQDGTARVGSAGLAAVVGGEQEWADYKYGADVQAGGGGLGLIFGYTAPNDYYIFRWAPPGSPVAYAGQAQIVHMTDSQAEVIKAAPLQHNARSKARAKVTIQQGLITGWLEGKPQIQALQEGLPGGAVGLYAEQANSVAFDNVYAEELPPPSTAHLAKEFTDVKKHRDMAEWGSRRAPWIAPEDPNRPDARWQTKGDYFGDKAVELTIPDIGSVAGTMMITVDADPDQQPSGYTLTIIAEKDSKTLQVVLLAESRKLTEGTVEVAGDSCSVRFARQGEYLITIVDDEVVFKQPVE